MVFSQEFRHSKFVAYKVKDAIVDYFREKTGSRPNISVTHPDLQLNIHIAENDCTLSLDSSGESLHRRGYRQEAVEAPLNEVLAAGMILMTGWDGECDLIDPMCGSGTIAIEAALIARGIAPGVFRKEYAFEKWPDFDKEMFDRIYNDESQEREFTHKIYGYDINRNAVDIATRNVKAAGLSKEIEIAQQDFHKFTQPAEKSIIITNPPYGERISTPDLLGLYRTIGERLKHQFLDNDAWVLSYREECFDQIGLKPSIKIPLYNGSLECEFRKYQIFSGKYKELRSEGKEIKTDEERRQMAENDVSRCTASLKGPLMTMKKTSPPEEGITTTATADRAEVILSTAVHGKTVRTEEGHTKNDRLNAKENLLNAENARSNAKTSRSTASGNLLTANGSHSEKTVNSTAMTKRINLFIMVSLLSVLAMAQGKRALRWMICFREEVRTINYSPKTCTRLGGVTGWWKRTWTAAMR